MTTEASRQLPTLVAVHGRKRSGKGTIAEHLVSAHGYTPVKFADALKEVICALLARAGIDPATAARCIESDLKEVPVAGLGGKSARYAMQVIGTEVRDSIHTAMWSNMAVERMRSIRSAGGRVVLDDLRFPHELAVLSAEGAALWLVTSSRQEPVAEERVVPECLRQGPAVVLGDEVVAEMVGIVLRHCGAAGASSSEPIPALGGRTGLDCGRAFREVFVPLMARPWTPGPATTAGHLSERPLPLEAFHAHLVNDTSYDALYDGVAVALGLRGLRAAA